MNFGRSFLKARSKFGLEQKEAAKELGISAAFLSKIENNKQKPSIDLILKAADFYGVKPGFFFEGQEEINLDSLYSVKNKEFIYDLDKMTDEELSDKYKIQIDGKELTLSELKGIMAYVRSLRSMEK
ncbi:helix-turn-helix transcriptional regulator [Bacillus sp. BRMEA1]|uniref:helix-turn-helix domain-containing protein n=1 Tax=Neobacillus endophyticus TaxID=2738405 RepID=UPI00156671B9|nr:helix-turn-helix transcriptional regulator [Neobacillus endophyticus]NRD80340.1 helix-turn-helix transcriptional regulator [Neobacillus endophyticus]